jgi:hypothetical protein
VTPPSVIWLAALAAEVAGALTDVDLQAIARVVDAVGDGNEDPADRAAALMYEVARCRPLARRNGRLAVLAADRWLDDAGLLLQVDDPDSAVKLLAAIDTGHADLDEVTTWVHAHCRSCEEATVFERFTDRARHVLEVAHEEARLLHHPWIGTEHILLGVISEGQGLGAQVLSSLGVDLPAARARVTAIVGTGDAVNTVVSTRFTPRAKKVLELSLREALHLQHNYVGTEHLVLGLIREGEGVGAKVLTEGFGLSLDRVREEVMRRLSGTIPGGPRPRRLWARGARGKYVPGQCCSFCGKSHHQVRKIVAGPDVCICDECVELCIEIIGDKLGERQGPCCPRCGRSLGHDTRTETVKVGGDQGRDIAILVCAGCGAALGTVA